MFAKENPITLKIISSHFVSETESRCILKSSMLSKSATEDVQPELYSIILFPANYEKSNQKACKKRKK